MLNGHDVDDAADVRSKELGVMTDVHDNAG